VLTNFNDLQDKSQVTQLLQQTSTYEMGLTLAALKFCSRLVSPLNSWMMMIIDSHSPELATEPSYDGDVKQLA